MHQLPLQQTNVTETNDVLNSALLSEEPPASPYKFGRNARICLDGNNGQVRADSFKLSHIPEYKPTNLGRNNSVQLPSALPPSIQESDLEVLETIGMGAFGKAYKARHRKYGYSLVIKELLRENKEDEEALIREICLLRHLKHPNILNCIGLVVRNKKICLVSEFVERGTLQGIILNSTPESMDWNRRVSFAADIANGMTFLHAHDIIHRDLTAYNCLVHRNDTVVVSDFGLSKLVLTRGSACEPWSQPVTVGDGSEQEAQLSQEEPDERPRRRMGRIRRHTVVGNPFWMAPEMLGNKPYDHHVDVYSFGVILCQLIARCDADPEQLPRNGDDLGVAMDEFLARYKSVEETVPSIILNTAKRCVDTDATSRPSFRDCQEWLDRCLFQLMTGRSPMDQPESDTNPELVLT